MQSAGMGNLRKHIRPNYLVAGAGAEARFQSAVFPGLKAGASTVVLLAQHYGYISSRLAQHYGYISSRLAQHYCYISLRLAQHYGYMRILLRLV
jgi:hypothetical protein